MLKLEKHPKWKGDSVEYPGLHTWLRNNYGKADFCDNKERKSLEFLCSGKSKTFEWAKKRGYSYERKRDNFLKLCTSCHRKYDWTEERGERMKETLLKSPLYQKGLKKKDIICKWCKDLFYPPKDTSTFCSKSCASRGKFTLDA